MGRPERSKSASAGEGGKTKVEGAELTLDVEGFGIGSDKQPYRFFPDQTSPRSRSGSELRDIIAKNSERRFGYGSSSESGS